MHALRSSAEGKKNFLFISSPQAGRRTAIIYSIIVSCQRRGIDPLANKTDVLEKLVPYDHRPPEELLEALLPENWIIEIPDKITKEPLQA